MKKFLNLILLVLFTAVAVHGQDTLYFDANNKRISSVDIAVSYKVCIPDTTHRDNVVEINYWKSGKIKSYKPLTLKFKENTDKSIIESYTAGKISLNDTILKRNIEKIKNGIYKEWYEDGQIRKEIEYKEGKYNGLYISYWENGQVKRKEDFGSKKYIEGKCFNPEGKEIEYTPMKQMPVFPGGELKLLSFLKQNIKYSEAMSKNKIKGTVLVQFIIKKDGSISNMKIIRGIHPDADLEAIRVISLMPKWIPSKQEDEPMNAGYTLSIRFSQD